MFCSLWSSIGLQPWISAPLVWQETVDRSRKICRSTDVRMGAYIGAHSTEIPSDWGAAALCVYGIVIPLNLYAEFKLLLSWGCHNWSMPSSAQSQSWLYTEAYPALCSKELSEVSWLCHSDIKERWNIFLEKICCVIQSLPDNFKNPETVHLNGNLAVFLKRWDFFSFQCIHPKGSASASPPWLPKRIRASARPREHSSAGTRHGGDTTAVTPQWWRSPWRWHRTAMWNSQSQCSHRNWDTNGGDGKEQDSLLPSPSAPLQPVNIFFLFLVL